MTDSTAGDGVLIYGTETCGDCVRAREWLHRNGIAYTDVDVAADRPARETALALAEGDRRIPVLRLSDGRVLVEPTDEELEAVLR